MDTEQLKLIVELINGLGAESKEAFVVYLVATIGGDLVGKLIGWIFTLVIFVVIAKAVRQFVSNWQRLDALLKMVRPGCSNDPWSSENESAYQQICAIVRNGVASRD